MVLNTVLFPQTVLPLRIFEPRYRAMLDHALRGSRVFTVAMPRRNSGGADSASPCSVAGLGMIRVAVKNPDGTSNLILQGLTRVRLGRVARFKPFREYRIEPMASEAKDSLVVDALRARVLELAEARARLSTPAAFQAIAKLAGDDSQKPDLTQFIQALARIPDPADLADFISGVFLRNQPRAQQQILESVDVEIRLKTLVHLLMMDVLRAQQESKSK